LRLHVVHAVARSAAKENEAMNEKTNIDAKTRLADATEAARQCLRLPTLGDRNDEALDYHRLSVASIRAVIALAFEAGYAAGRDAANPGDQTRATK
jgi:hypothetical protein